jgi:hypothetical protein
MNTPLKKEPDHIHRVGDGRGLREVHCDGEKIHRCIYADTQRGTVKFYGKNPVMNAECDGYLIHERCGKVDVFFIPEIEQELVR